MRDIFRDIDLPIDDRTLTNLDGLTKDDIMRVARLHLPQAAVTRLINRLHNRQKDGKAKEIRAYQLVSQGFEAMAEVEFEVDDLVQETIQGRITNARSIENGNTVAITVLAGRHIESTWIVERDDTVRVWPKEVRYPSMAVTRPVDYDKVADNGYLRASYIAENLSTFFGKRMSVKNVGTGVLQRVVVKADDQDYFYFDLGIVRNVKVHKNALVQVYKTLEPEQLGLSTSDYTNVRARAILATPQYYLGRRVVFDDDRVDGILTEVVRKADTAGVILRVDGEQTQLAWNEMVKVYPREHAGLFRHGRNPWGPSPTPPPPPGRNPFIPVGRRAGGSALGQAYGRYLESLGLTVPANPEDQPDYRGDSWWMFNNRPYVGATIQLGSGDPAKSGVKGVCTQITYENGKLIFVIDGLMYKRNRHTLVKVWDKKENN